MLPHKILSCFCLLLFVLGQGALANEGDGTDWEQFAQALRHLPKTGFKTNLIVPASVARGFREREEKTEKSNLNYLWQETGSDNVLHLTPADHAVIKRVIDQWLPATGPDEETDVLTQGRIQRLALTRAVTIRARSLPRLQNPEIILRLRKLLGHLYDRRIQKLDQAMIEGDQAKVTDVRADLLRIASEAFLIANFYDPGRALILSYARELHTKIFAGAASIVAIAATAWTFGFHDHPVLLAASTVFPLVAEVFKKVNVARIKQGHGGLLGGQWIKAKLRQRWLAHEKIELNQPSQGRSIDFTPSELAAACERYLDRAKAP